MNTIKRFCLTAILLLFSANAILGFEYDGLYYYIINDNECGVGQNSGVLGDINIPRVVYNIYVDDEGVTHKDTYRVIRVGNNAFYKCSSLTSVNIPNSVTSIGYAAFYGCI